MKIYLNFIILNGRRYVCALNIQNFKLYSFVFVSKRFKLMHILNYVSNLVGIKFTAIGTTGYASMLQDNTAGEKLYHVMSRLLSLREAEKLRMHLGKSLKLGDVTTINLNMIQVWDLNQKR